MEIGLFVKELYSFAENVNEIDDETIKMLSEVILAVDKLTSTAQFRGTPTSHTVDFVQNFNDEHLECRRYIFCRLCGVMNNKIISDLVLSFSTKIVICLFLLGSN